ncbi:MAG: extracellular solute-binding protein, partial [Bacteroidota bacterium]|nr:extracellular solute-binding protein [Bacteroidota bacterium]
MLKKTREAAMGIAVMVLVVFIAGTCAVKVHSAGGNDNHRAAVAAARPVETITLATGKDINHIYPMLIGEFMKKNPDIKVIYSELPFSTDDQHNILATKFSAEDTGYDVVSLDQVWTAEFAEAGWLEPLNRYFPRQQWKNYFDWAIKAVTYKDNIYAVPKVVDAG